MRLLLVAFVSTSLVCTAAAASAEPVTLDPIRIALRPVRPLVTDVAAPAKTLLAANPPPSLAPRIAEPVGRAPF
ncbi:MAG: hypothetical protein NVS3B10_13510 [Polyangiales bacterium]